MNDDELRTRARRTDPAAALRPLDGDARAAVLDRAAASPARMRRARLPIVLIAGLATAAVAAVLLVPRPTDGPTVVLRASGTDPQVSCAPLADFAVSALRGSDLAFSGRVESASSTEVEIVPDRVFRGPAAGLVRLRAGQGGGPALDGADLRQGEQVLVAASDGEVAGCGLSAAESPELRRVYEQAFG